MHSVKLSYSTPYYVNGVVAEARSDVELGERFSTEAKILTMSRLTHSLANRKALQQFFFGTFFTTPPLTFSLAARTALPGSFE